MAALILPSRRIVSAYPAGTPSIDWDNPITKGLRGFLWMGGPKPVDLVEPLTQWATSGATRIQGGRGPLTSVTGAVTGVYTPRNSVASLGAWAITQLPISLFGFFSFDTTASTRNLLTVGQGSGIALLDVYGLRTRFARVYVDGVQKSAEGGTWSTGAAVRGAVFGPTNVKIYDEGAAVAQSFTDYTAGSVSYAPPYSRVAFLGDPDATPIVGTGYWAGVWAREFSAGEARSLQAQPFQMLRSQPRKFFLVSAGGAITLVGSGAAQAATSGAGALTQAHALLGAGSAQAAASATAAIAQAHTLAGAASTQAAACSTGAITLSQQLTTPSNTQAASSGTGALTQVHALAGAATAQAAASGTGALSQVHALVGAGSAQAATSSTGELTSAGSLQAAPSSQAATSGTGVITQVQALAGAASAQAAASGTGTLTQVQQLTTASASQSATSGTGAVTVGVVIHLAAAACSQAATVATGAIAQAHQLLSVACTQAAASGVAALTQLHQLLGATCAQVAASAGVAVVLGEIAASTFYAITVAGRSLAVTVPARTLSVSVAAYTYAIRR